MGTTAYNPEAHLPDTFKSFNSYQLEKVKFQMKNCICKIRLGYGKIGTGFFCKIPFPDTFSFLPVLITCYHVLDKNNISQGEKINFSLNNDQVFRSIIINNSRKTLISEEKDVTIIEIKPKEDNIEAKSFLEIDEEIDHNDPRKIYNNITIYITHYEKGDEAKYSIGKILNIDEDQINIEHECSTQTGSSGSPIINLNNFKVIGVHKGFNKLNFGTLLKIPIVEFNQLYKNFTISKNKENIENIKNNQLSVIIKDEYQKLHSLICKKTDYFSSLEIELFKKDLSLKDQKHYYIANEKKIDISKTIEQNNITDSSIIYYKIEEREENNNEDDEEISVIIKSMNLDFKSSFLIKKSDKFKVLEQKLYER